METIDYDGKDIGNTEQSDKEINGSPIYFSTKQVAEILFENESTIRYWCDEFDEFLHIIRAGRNRRFTKNDINKLTYIKYLLKEKNFSIRQVREFLTTKEAALMKPIKDEKEQIIINALSNLIKNNLKEMEARMVDNISRQILEQLPDIIINQIDFQEQIVYKISNEVNSALTSLESEIKKRDTAYLQWVENIRRNQEDSRKGFLGFFKNIFKKRPSTYDTPTSNPPK